MTANLHNPNRPPPPLREAHAHLHMLGEELELLNLSSCTSVEHCLTLLREHALQQQGAWLRASAARIESWTDPRWPTLAELTSAVPTRPLCIFSFDHHAAVVNAPALAASGLAHGALPPGVDAAHISRDRTGNPTGHLVETAAKHAWMSAPQPAASQRAPLIARALSHLHAVGFAEVHDLLAPPWLGPILAQLHDEGKLHLEVSLFAPLDTFHEQVASSALWTRPNHAHTTGRASGRAGVRLAGAKVFADGTLNSRTAWVLHPYADAPQEHAHGLALLREPALRDALLAAHHHTLALAVHAIGDAAVRAALDAHVGACSALGLAPTSRSAPALRIEHCELIDERDVPRFAQQHVVASVQPCHLLADIEVLTRALPTRLHRVLPLRDLLTSGCTPGRTLLFGSDVPIVRANPEDSVIAAKLRTRTNASPIANPPAPPVPIAPEQALTREECWACFATTPHA